MLAWTGLWTDGATHYRINQLYTCTIISKRQLAAEAAKWRSK